MATRTKKAPKKTAAKKTTKKSAPKKATKKAAPATDAQRLAGLQKSYPHIAAIALTNEKGKPIRVVISCQADYGLDDCQGEREIATQDAFQVQRCAPCQREFSKIRRRKTPTA